MILKPLVLLGLVLLGCGCLSGGLPSTPPEYVHSVYAAQAGSDGLTLYYILADKNGQMTTSDGELRIAVQDDRGILWVSGCNVSRNDFRKAKIGAGAFEREVALHNLGRLELRREPSGKVTTDLTFITQDGRILKGQDTTYF